MVPLSLLQERDYNMMPLSLLQERDCNMVSLSLFQERDCNMVSLSLFREGYCNMVSVVVSEERLSTSWKLPRRWAWRAGSTCGFSQPPLWETDLPEMSPAQLSLSDSLVSRSVPAALNRHLRKRECVLRASIYSSELRLWL